MSDNKKDSQTSVEKKLVGTIDKLEQLADIPRQRARERRAKAQANPYATFNDRVFASVIDIALSFMILGPIMLGLSKLLYGGTVRANPLYGLPNYTNWEQISANADDIFLHLHAQGFFTHLLLDYTIHFVVFGALILWLWGISSATPGKWLLRMRIADATTFCKPTTKQLVIRYCAYIVSMLPLTFGFIWILFDAKNRAWHDILSNTVVVKVRHWQFKDDGLTPHVILEDDE